MARLESKQSHPLLDQMVNPNVRDDMPIANFIASSSSGFGPTKSRTSRDTTRSVFSSVMLAAAITNVGDPRLVIPGCSPCSLLGYVSKCDN